MLKKTAAAYDLAQKFLQRGDARNARLAMDIGDRLQGLTKQAEVAASIAKIASKLDQLGLSKEAAALDQVLDALVKSADAWTPREDYGQAMVGGTPGDWNVHAVGAFVRDILKARVPYQLQMLKKSLTGEPTYVAALDDVASLMDSINPSTAGRHVTAAEAEAVAKKALIRLGVILRELEKAGDDMGPEYDVANGMRLSIEAGLENLKREREKWSTKTHTNTGVAGDITDEYFNQGSVGEATDPGRGSNKAQNTLKKMR